MNFESTYKENYPKMFCMASKMVGDEDVAGDIVQDVFAYYFEKLQGGYVIRLPQNWLVRATVNKSIDYLNQRKKRTSLSDVDNLTAEVETFEIQQPDVILRQAIAELKPMEMKLIALYSEGYSYKEIAQIAEIKFSSVGKTLSRILDKLKGILKKMDYEMC